MIATKLFQQVEIKRPVAVMLTVTFSIYPVNWSSLLRSYMYCGPGSKFFTKQKLVRATNHCVKLSHHVHESCDLTITRVHDSRHVRERARPDARPRAESCETGAARGRTSALAPENGAQHKCTQVPQPRFAAAVFTLEVR